MCLETKHLLPKIAKEDIPVYKVLALSTDGLETPYRFMKIINPIIKPTLYSKIVYLSTFIFNLITYLINKKVYIDSGFIHVYPKKLYVGYNRVLIKAIIPKGSLYYKGLFCDTESYCASKIILDNDDYTKYTGY